MCVRGCVRAYLCICIYILGVNSETPYRLLKIVSAEKPFLYVPNKTVLTYIFIYRFYIYLKF